MLVGKKSVNITRAILNMYVRHLSYTLAYDQILILEQIIFPTENSRKTKKVF